MKKTVVSTESVKPTRNAAAFGVIRFDGSAIVYTAWPEALTLPLSEIAAIGEYTSESGPYADDWFLVFVNRHDGRWLEVSMYEEGPFLLEQLSNALGVSLKIGLFDRTCFTSRIIWPATLAGRPLFTFERVVATSFLRQLKLLLYRSFPTAFRWMPLLPSNKRVTI